MQSPCFLDEIYGFIQNSFINGYIPSFILLIYMIKIGPKNDINKNNIQCKYNKLDSKILFILSILISQYICVVMAGEKITVPKPEGLRKK